MELFERYEELTAHIDLMNAQATAGAAIPYIRLHDYVHYCDVKTFLHDYARRLPMSAEDKASLLLFCYRDTLDMKGRIGERDLYAFTFRYFKSMIYRTGNLDTPDDCVEKLDMDRFAPYRAAREKQWQGLPLTADEQKTLEYAEKKILNSMTV